MAQLGQDLHLRHLLLEVSRDLEAEAALIEAGRTEDRREHSRIAMGHRPAWLTVSDLRGPPLRCEVVDLSQAGARVECPVRIAIGTPVELEPYADGPMLPGRVVRADETQDMTFHIAIKFATGTEAAAEEVMCYLALEAERGVNGADSTTARPALNNSDRNASSPLNLEEIGRSSSASSAS